MKLLSLNIQSGAQSPRFLRYIREKRKNLDIFCFQEVLNSSVSRRIAGEGYTDIFAQLKMELQDFTPFYFSVSNTVGRFFKLNNKVVLGLAIFVKKSIKTGKHFGIHVSGRPENRVDFFKGKEANAVQCLEIFNAKKSLWILNFHGMSQPGNKLDTRKRISQSTKLVKVLKGLPSNKILCGDFNLMPETKSIRMIEKEKMINLIARYKIKNTRNTVSWKKYGNKQYFADFVFVSAGVKVKNFKVPYTLASDHLPMVLDFVL